MILKGVFTTQNTRTFFWITIGSIAMSFLEVLSIASVAPFMSVVADQNLIKSNEYLNLISQFFSFNSSDKFIIFLGLFFLITLTISNAFIAFMNWSVNSFVYKLGSEISIRLLKKYISRPYSFFLKNNSVDLIKNILNEVDRVITGVIRPATIIFSKLFMVFTVFVFLAFISFEMATFSILVLGGIYFIVFKIFQRKIVEDGHLITALTSKRYKYSSDSIIGIKELKILGVEENFIKKFSESSNDYAKISARNIALSFIPRYFLEIVAFGGIILFVVFLISSGRENSEIFPILSLYAVGGYRLIPALQQVYENYVLLKHNWIAFENLAFDLSVDDDSPGDKKILFQKNIKFSNIKFNFTDAKRATLDINNLSINKGEVIGLIGKTGSGKTTLIDLMMGLHRPQEGSIHIDNEVLDESNIRSWQKIIGYVPQNIFLLDESIEKNIVFGRRKTLDHELMSKTLELACLSEFIEDLPQGVDSIVGDRGTKLSGGQRQRIGIARAIYNNPEILIFDEATSALDNETENNIMKSIDLIRSKTEITIIIIAHRTSTLTCCDKIFELDKGKIIKSGSYNEFWT